MNSIRARHYRGAIRRLRARCRWLEAELAHAEQATEAAQSTSVALVHEAMEIRAEIAELRAAIHHSADAGILHTSIWPKLLTPAEIVERFPAEPDLIKSPGDRAPKGRPRPWRRPSRGGYTPENVGPEPTTPPRGPAGTSNPKGPT